MITLKQLAHAMALKRHGNFHRAADAENISQPALSRSIRALEETLGVSLFDRQGASVTPTLFGEALLQRAQKMFGETDELLREIQLLKGLEAGRLAIALGVYAAEMSASRAAGELLQRYPKLSCRLQLTSWKQVADLVRSRAVDLGIAEISTLQDANDLQVEPVGNHRVVFYCRRDHPLARRGRLSKADLDACPVVTVRLPSRVADVFPGKTRLDRETGELIPSIEVDDLATARNIVQRSDAFGAATPVQIEPWLRSGELRALPFDAPWMRLDYGFIHLRNRMLSPAAVVYMQLVRDIDRELGRHNAKLMSRISRGFASDQAAQG